MSSVIKATSVWITLKIGGKAPQLDTLCSDMGPVVPEGRAVQPWESMAKEDMVHGDIKFTGKTNISSVFVAYLLLRQAYFCGDLVGDKRGKTSIPCSFEASEK